MDSNLSVADIAAVTDRNGYGCNGFGGGMYGMEFLLTLLILPMMWGGGFGGWGNRGCNGGNPVTEAGLCNAMNANNLENAVGRLSDAVQAGQRQTDNAVCNLGYQALNLANQNQRDMCTGFTSVTGAVNQARFENQQCCCDTQKLIQQGQYQDAMNTAAINANTTAVGQKILDKMCENEANALRSRVQQLELQAALCGIPRTNPYGYGIYTYNACGGCGCNGWGNGNI